MITVIDIESLPAHEDGGADVIDFLNHATVGANIVEGSMYRVPAGTRIEPFSAGGSHQLFYVRDGELVVELAGERHDLGPGQGVYCGPGESCRFENAGAGDVATFFRFVVADS